MKISVKKKLHTVLGLNEFGSVRKINNKKKRKKKGNNEFEEKIVKKKLYIKKIFMN